MKNLFETYMTHKKITIPVTVLVAVLAVGGIAYGVTASHKDSDNKKTSAKTEKVVVPEYICYDKAGTYSDKLTYTAGDITASDVTVENATFTTLTITESVGDGSVTLNNDTVKEVLVVNGGGTNSLHINGGTYEEIISNDYDCHIVIDEACAVNTLTVPASALIEVNGTVKTANVVPSTYDGEITWETGFKAGEKANVEALNIAEEVKKDVKIEDATGNAVKEQKALTKAETNKVQNNAQSATSTAQNTTSNAKQEVVSGGGNTSATNNSANTGSSKPSGGTSVSSNNGSSGSSSSPNNTNTGSGKPSGGSTTNTPNNDSKQPTTPTVSYVTCPDCGETYEKGTTHNCSVMRTCDYCGAKYKYWEQHDCPYTTDYYGNKVRKDSRYVVAVGNYDIKKYSDGSYDVPQSARDTLASSYESEKYAYGDNWVNNPRLTSIDAWCISCSGI